MTKLTGTTRKNTASQFPDALPGHTWVIYFLSSAGIMLQRGGAAAVIICGAVCVTRHILENEQGGLLSWKRKKVQEDV